MLLMHVSQLSWQCTKQQLASVFVHLFGAANNLFVEAKTIFHAASRSTSLVVLTRLHFSLDRMSL